MKKESKILLLFYISYYLFRRYFMATSPNTTMIVEKVVLNIRWRSVFAGVIFALAIAWVMYLLGSAIGLSIINPYEQDPTSGFGYGAAVWIFLTWIISLFMGGLLAGR